MGLFRRKPSELERFLMRELERRDRIIENLQDRLSHAAGIPWIPSPADVALLEEPDESHAKDYQAQPEQEPVY